MSPTVSVALCTHDGERFVTQQVQGILDQSPLPNEVVLSDDASSDGTVAIVEALWAGLDAASAPRLVVLRNAVPLGVTANFQQATAACTSDLVALSDQDDVWLPGRLALMVAHFAGRPELGLLFTDAQLVDAGGKSLGASLFEALEIGPAVLGRVHGGEAFSVLVRRNIVTGATVVFRRSLLGSAAPFDPSWVHDEWLAIIAAAVSTVDVLPDRLIDYRQHSSNHIGVAVPTLGYKIGRVFEPRADRYTNLLARALALQARLERLDADPVLLATVAQKVEHQRRRASLPAVRLARVVPVLREVRTGRYGLFSSQGNLDILRDLLQPDR